MDWRKNLDIAQMKLHHAAWVRSVEGTMHRGKARPKSPMHKRVAQRRRRNEIAKLSMRRNRG